MSKPKTVTDMARMGGKARWQRVDKQTRSDKMREVVRVRWAKYRANKTSP